ncbi:hypothetical protein V6Z11_A04G064600 [Gossypium hirsutum]
MASSKGFRCGQRRGGQKVWAMVWDACFGCCAP